MCRPRAIAVQLRRSSLLNRFFLWATLWMLWLVRIFVSVDRRTYLVLSAGPLQKLLARIGMVFVFADGRALHGCIRHKIIWPILADECHSCDRLDNFRSRDRNTRRLFARAFSSAAQPRQQTLSLDSFDKNVSGDCNGRSFVPDDARSPFNKYSTLFNHRIHGFQSAICGLDDAWLLRRTATRFGRSSVG